MTDSKAMQSVSNQELIATLQNSLYVGAKAESVEMVIGYCQAAGLDVMQKPVHIVPMNTKNAVTGEYEWRDVIMPGIGLYRIQADRSKTLAGAGEPEFGPELFREFKDKKGNESKFRFPEWCKVSIKKLVGNHIVEFIAKEYWLENYATDSRNSSAPNAMWKKRPKGQLAKCAEAQALRKGWPEIGQAPTAEEMEGKAIDMGDAEVVNKEPLEPEIVMYPVEDFDKNKAAWKGLIDSGKRSSDEIIAMVESKGKLTDEQKKTIRGEQ